MADEIVDVDKTWKGEGSLDEHRHREFAKIKHPGFSKGSTQQPVEPSPPEDITDDESSLFTAEESD